MNLPDNQTFLTEFREWRRGRREWSLLIAAVRRGAPPSELAGLAADAGATGDEVHELVGVRVRAKAFRKEAAQYPAAKKALDTFDAKIAELRKRAETAGRTECGGIMHELAALRERRDRCFRGVFVGARLAADYVNGVATPLGVI